MATPPTALLPLAARFAGSYSGLYAYAQLLFARGTTHSPLCHTLALSVSDWLW